MEVHARAEFDTIVSAVTVQISAVVTLVTLVTLFENDALFGNGEGTNWSDDRLKRER